MLDKRWYIGIGLLIVLAIIEYSFFFESGISPNGTVKPRNCTAVSFHAAEAKASLAPGELPGYTGWARPEHTLARFFVIDSISSQNPRTGETFTIDVSCASNEACQATSTFFLRAYGPSVIPGTIENKGPGKYSFHYYFIDPGQYTVEAVLTYSNPPPIERFPLENGQEEPPFEGYLLPSFPVQVTVAPLSTNRNNDGAGSKNDGMESKNENLCTLSNLIEKTQVEGSSASGQSSYLESKSTLTSAESNFVSKSRWMVTSKSNAPGYVGKSSKVTKTGYKHNVNSLGIQMDYQFKECSLISESSLQSRQMDSNPFASCPKNLHVLFIGDSVMRVQKTMFDELLGHLVGVKTSYIDLYGGFRKVQRGTPSLKAKLREIEESSKGMTTLVLFNTGLHDIHRLCAHSWREDRFDYLNKDILEGGSFSCIREYRELLDEFAKMIVDLNATLRVFQTTTAAWPKYGNFGILWPLDAQRMPMTPDIIPHFNEVAFDVLEKYTDTIQIIDGYWITYSRPDNREVGEIGNKLSHPGLEVQSAMVRIWAMVILRAVCTLPEV